MRDSLFWQATLPGERLGFQAYLYLTHAGKAGFNVVVWGEDAKPLVFDFAEGTIPAEMNLDDFTFAGLRLRKTGFGEPAKVEYESAKVKLAFTFTGSHPPFSYHANPDGLPSWFAMNRYEQTGTITGSIEAKGRTIALDGMAHRDHSWGNRMWGVPQHWKWFCAYTPDGARMVNGWIWIARGEWGCAGYVVRDGRQLAIATIRQHAIYRDDMSQQSLRAEIVDVEGETCLVELERFGLVKLPGRDKFGTIIMEAACTGRIDGQEAAGQFETQWQQSYLDGLIESGATG
ncbi:DUF7064 domain-containing protein [Sphingomonas sp. ID0503]|uniref:DUF7064 domain-containing protein n=1 Tax=Sphingomonas sp. ID0503 TaxID=3399691 RepID=UPI003AFAEFCC